MKNVLIIVLLLISKFSFSQLKVEKITRSALPKGVQFEGIIKNAVRWKDSLGVHIVIATETGITPSKNGSDEGNRDAALYAYHYLVLPDSVKLTWKVYDYIKNCPVDISANFIKNTFAVTDLNKDGKAEVWLMYKTVCHGDVSPSNMKIIMYEKDIKHAVRGTNRVRYSEKEYTGGEYSFDEAFKSAPAVFQNYALTLWKKNLMETWE